MRFIEKMLLDALESLVQQNTKTETTFLKGLASLLTNSQDQKENLTTFFDKQTQNQKFLKEMLEDLEKQVNNQKEEIKSLKEENKILMDQHEVLMNQQKVLMNQHLHLTEYIKK